jgi:hypothetical protein
VARRLKDFRVQLGLIALSGLLIRVFTVLNWSRQFDPQGDQNFYWRQAQDLAQGFGFVYRNNFGERIPTAAHPPLYSAYLGVVGLLGFSEDSHVPYRLASTLLGFVAVIIIGLTARRIAGNRAGLIAAALAAVYPNLWLNDAMMISESMFSLTVALVLLAAYRCRDRLSTLNVVMLGVATALAALTRAEAAVLIVILVVPVILLTGRGRPNGARVPDGDPPVAWGTLARKSGLALLAAAVVVGPWVVRNYFTFSSHPVTLSNGSGFVVEISNCDQTYGLAAPTDGAGNPLPNESPDKLLGYWAVECDRTPWPAGDETVVAAAKGQAGVAYIDEHKKRFPLVVAARVGRIWDVWRPVQSYELNKFFERRGDLTTIAAMAMYYPLALAALGGLWVLIKRRVTVVPFLALFVMTTLTAAISFGITRYRVGADVGLVVLAGVALDALLSRWPILSPEGSTP